MPFSDSLPTMLTQVTRLQIPLGLLLLPGPLTWRRHAFQTLRSCVRQERPCPTLNPIQRMAATIHTATTQPVSQTSLPVWVCPGHRQMQSPSSPAIASSATRLLELPCVREKTVLVQACLRTAGAPCSRFTLMVSSRQGINACLSFACSYMRVLAGI